LLSRLYGLDPRTGNAKPAYVMHDRIPHRRKYPKGRWSGGAVDQIVGRRPFRAACAAPFWNNDRQAGTVGARGIEARCKSTHLGVREISGKACPEQYRTFGRPASGGLSRISKWQRVPPN
jgi:hypothetical protein